MRGFCATTVCYAQLFYVFFLPETVTEITSDQLINSVTRFCIVTKHDHECCFSFAALSPLCLFPWCEFSVTSGDGNAFSLFAFVICVCEVAMAGLTETAAGVQAWRHAHFYSRPISETNIPHWSVKFSANVVVHWRSPTCISLGTAVVPVLHS